MPLTKLACHSLGTGQSVVIHKFISALSSGINGSWSSNTLNCYVGNNSGGNAFAATGANAVITGSPATLTYSIGGSGSWGLQAFYFYSGLNQTGSILGTVGGGGNGSVTVPVGTQSVYISGYASGNFFMPASFGVTATLT